MLLTGTARGRAAAPSCPLAVFGRISFIHELNSDNGALLEGRVHTLDPCNAAHTEPLSKSLSARGAMEHLADEDFKSGAGIPFIALEGEGQDAKFTLCDEAAQFLQTLKAPLALASIVGKYRTGKSLLVNRMLLDLKGGGFAVGYASPTPARPVTGDRACLSPRAGALSSIDARAPAGRR